LPNFQRKDILQNIAQQIKSREDEIATVLAVEVGKTLKEAKIEVTRYFIS
jgi:acyl-CoA reductase-like NAD-dependent aldehyde dehydrogenase